MPSLTSVLHDLLVSPHRRGRLKKIYVLQSRPALALWRRTGPATKFTPHDRDRRHPLCSFAHGLPSHWRGADRAVQLALCPWTRRQDAAADRGHRPRTLDRSGDRGDPRWAVLAWPRLGRRHRLPVLALRAPPRGS